MCYGTICSETYWLDSETGHSVSQCSEISCSEIDFHCNIVSEQSVP